MNKLNKINRTISKIDTANGMITKYYQIPEVKHAKQLIAEASILLGEVAEELEMEGEDE